MEKEISTDSVINLPKKLTEKKILGYNIVIAPDFPNWIVLDDDEYILFSLIKKMKIIDAMNSFASNYNKEDDYVIEKTTSLISKIEDVSFYNDAVCNAEEEIENFPKLIHINLTNNCNLRCLHCYMSAGKMPETKLDIKKIINAVGQINKYNKRSNIVISGGEPLVYKDFLFLLESLKENDITLFSNGTLINQKNYQKICDICKEVQLSFEGVTKEKYEEVRGRGNFEKVMTTISLLKKKNVRIVFAITILPSTLDDIEKNLIPFIEKINYDNIEIRLNSDIEMAGNALDLDMTQYDEKRSKQIIVKLMEDFKKRGVSVSYTADVRTQFKNCGIGTNVVINYDGKIYPCNRFSKIYFDLDSFNYDEVKKNFDSLNKKTSVDFFEKCSACELKHICSGGCRINNLKENGDMCIPICSEEFKETQYKKLVYDYLRW